MLLFSNVNKQFFGYFDPEQIFLDKKLKNRGDIRDVSAIKLPPESTSKIHARNTVRLRDTCLWSVKHGFVTSTAVYVYFYLDTVI